MQTRQQLGVPEVPGIQCHAIFQMDDWSLLCLGLPCFHLSTSPLTEVPHTDSAQSHTDTSVSLWALSGGSTIDPPSPTPRKKHFSQPGLCLVNQTVSAYHVPFFQMIPLPGTVYLPRRHRNPWLDIQLSLWHRRYEIFPNFWCLPPPCRSKYVLPLSSEHRLTALTLLTDIT